MSNIDIGKKAPTFTLEGTRGSWSPRDAADDLGDSRFDFSLLVIFL